MKHMKKIFEAYNEVQAKAVADKVTELRDHYKSLEEVASANQLMYEVFDMTHTVEPYLSLYFPEEQHEGWIFTNRGGISYTSIELNAKVNDGVAEKFDKKIQKLSEHKEVELVVDYDMLIGQGSDRGRIDWWQRKSHDLKVEQIVEILDQVERIETVAGGVAVLEFDSYYSKPSASMSAGRATPKKLILISTDPIYQKWKKFIPNANGKFIKLRRITFLFKVGVKVVSEDFGAVVPKSVIVDFKSFCDEHNLGFESRKRLAAIFAAAKG
jgi:hypothetical protein